MATKQLTVANNDTVTVAALPVNLALPSIGSGVVATSIKLTRVRGGDSQDFTGGQSVDLLPSDTVTLTLDTKEESVSITVDYTNTTEPTLRHGD